MALVELALVAFPLCLIVFGAVDLGRGYFYLTQLRNAARAGALFAQQSPTSVVSGVQCPDPNNVTYQVANEILQSGATSLPAGDALTVTDLGNPATPPGTTFNGCLSGNFSAGDTIQVEVTSPFTMFTPLISQIVGPLTLHATVNVVAQ